MSILTDRDIELLTSLHTNWRRRYLDEVARLLKGDDAGAWQTKDPKTNSAVTPELVYVEQG